MFPEEVAGLLRDLLNRNHKSLSWQVQSRSSLATAQLRPIQTLYWKKMNNGGSYSFSGSLRSPVHLPIFFWKYLCLSKWFSLGLIRMTHCLGSQHSRGEALWFGNSYSCALTIKYNFKKTFLWEHIWEWEWPVHLLIKKLGAIYLHPLTLQDF